MLAYDRMAERMERLAAIDELTGAFVRREFMAQAQLQLERANRTQSRFTVAILDIDNFKAVNDSHGHATGDCALALFSSIVSQGIHWGDIFGRLGGEEFAILFPETSRADALILVNSVRLHLATSTLAVPCGEVTCTFSAGVDEYQPAETLANLMARSDAALYSAKAMGRNRVVSAVAISAMSQSEPPRTRRNRPERMFADVCPSVDYTLVFARLCLGRLFGFKVRGPRTTLLRACFGDVQSVVAAGAG